MLRTSHISQPKIKPEIQRAVTSVVKEDTDFDRINNRSAVRESLVRAVKIENKDSESSIIAFSRNISATGLGLITSEPIDQNTASTLKISRLNDPDLAILSECRWCKPYGEGWYLSGWQFITLKHSFSQHKPSGISKALSNRDIENAFEMNS